MVQKETTRHYLDRLFHNNAADAESMTLSDFDNLKEEGGSIVAAKVVPFEAFAYSTPSDESERLTRTWVEGVSNRKLPDGYCVALVIAYPEYVSDRGKPVPAGTTEEGIAHFLTSQPANTLAKLLNKEIKNGGKRAATKSAA